MSQVSTDQMSQILSILEKNLQATKNDDDLSSESEFEMEEQKKNIEESRTQEKKLPVGKVTHQKYCINCGSADNLFRNNKYKTCIVCCNRRTRPPQSENQKKAFERCRAKRAENVERRKQLLKEFEEQAKQEMDSKVVRKAIAVKKKSLLREAKLEEISDEEETPLEEVIKIAKKTEAKKQRKSIPKKQKEVEEKVEYEQPQQQYYYTQPSFSFA
jgi:hypothetical protein